ncbi:hypothetical protein [Streptomyces europaeiscabiei]|uniref:hypothetical protein n=1 Tax=Streptomyces europaeiscabiei TaxID=146819 RepID=UPI0029B9D9F3|nr:hypothetical protein [Streptomyces europaeiscabiei]MDX3779146.1 hypothetical protein [Streptomyces europaeiscabiei]
MPAPGHRQQAGRDDRSARRDRASGPPRAPVEGGTLVTAEALAGTGGGCLLAAGDAKRR